MKCEYVDYFRAAISQNYAICLAPEVNCLSSPCLYKTQLKSDTFTNLNSNFLSREEEGGVGGGGGGCGGYIAAKGMKFMPTECVVQGQWSTETN